MGNQSPTVLERAPRCSRQLWRWAVVGAGKRAAACLSYKCMQLHRTSAPCGNPSLHPPQRTEVPAAARGSLASTTYNNMPRPSISRPCHMPQAGACPEQEQAGAPLCGSAGHRKQCSVLSLVTLLRLHARHGFATVTLAAAGAQLTAQRKRKSCLALARGTFPLPLPS